MNNHINYPPMPVNVDPEVIKPSATFKKSVVNVTLAMLLFVVVYVLMLIGAMAIAIAFGGAGLGLMYIYPSFITLAIGAGFIISGVMLLYFLVKFIFKSNKADVSGMLEITAQEQPELFAFIRQLTAETQSPFPKKIFLTANVNAGVSYNSTFWSMFFPVKKNLQIGLGLVNCLNLSEFKAVMAHEFGHFSQRSMKFGSYTYNMNRVIYNMLYDNEGYAQTLNTLGNVHSFIRLGIYINIQVIKGIQALLRKIYVVVNRSYLKLSREMEFHADAVSAYVTGSNHTINSLRRIELSQVCYDSTFNYLNILAKDKKRPDNIYPQHVAVMSLFAANNQLRADAAGIPVIDKKLAVLNNTQIVIADQWSSHPSIDEREQHLNAINVITDTTDLPAWSLFTNPEELQLRLSNMVYEGVPEPYDVIDTATAKQIFDQKTEENSYSKTYKGYHDGRYLTEFDMDELTARPYQKTNISFNEWLNDERINLPARIQGIKGDMATVKAIYEGDQVKTFDFKGIKYNQIDAPNIEKYLQTELAETEEQLKETDKEMFLYFYHHAAQPQKIADAYNDFFACQQRTIANLTRYEKLIDTISPIYTNMLPNDIERTLDLVYALEKDFKPHMKTVLDDPLYCTSVLPEQKEAIEAYLKKDLVYYTSMYNEVAIGTLNKALSAYFAIVDDHYFSHKKELLKLQLAE